MSTWQNDRSRSQPYDRPKRAPVKRRQRIQPPPPKPCFIEDTKTGRQQGGPYPSRSVGRRALARLIRDLPPRKSKDEPKRYILRNQ